MEYPPLPQKSLNIDEVFAFFITDFRNVKHFEDFENRFEGRILDVTNHPSVVLEESRVHHPEGSTTRVYAAQIDSDSSYYPYKIVVQLYKNTLANVHINLRITGCLKTILVNQVFKKKVNSLDKILNRTPTALVPIGISWEDGERGTIICMRKINYAGAKSITFTITDKNCF